MSGQSHPASPAGVRGAAALATALGMALACAAAAEVPEAQVVLEVRPPARPGFFAEALPPRFVLMPDGRVFVGGYAGLAAGQLDKSEMKALDKRLAQLRRMPGLATSIRFGPGEQRFRLALPKARLDVVGAGDPAAAPVELRLLSSLVADLSEFSHPSLRPLKPTQFLVSARAEALAGGCRPWTLRAPLQELAAAPQSMPAESVSGWPTGGIAASVCRDQRRYAVTFRPLLAGERP